MAASKLETTSIESRAENVNKNPNSKFFGVDGYINTDEGGYDLEGSDSKKKNDNDTPISDHTKDYADILKVLSNGGNEKDKEQRRKQSGYKLTNNGKELNSYSKDNEYGDVTISEISGQVKIY